MWCLLSNFLYNVDHVLELLIDLFFVHIEWDLIFYEEKVETWQIDRWFSRGLSFGGDNFTQASFLCHQQSS